jgi:hypothetical protein
LRCIVNTSTGETCTLSEIRAEQLLQMESLRDSIHAVHNKATEAASSRRASKREKSTHARAATAANFDIGDFVLVARRETNSGEKLTLRWRGPKRIVATLSDHVYEVQDLGSGIITPVHCTRLRYYHDPSLDITADLRDQIAHNNQGYDVQALKDLRYDSSIRSLSRGWALNRPIKRGNPLRPFTKMFRNYFVYFCPSTRTAHWPRVPTKLSHSPTSFSGLTTSFPKRGMWLLHCRRQGYDVLLSYCSNLVSHFYSSTHCDH